MYKIEYKWNGPYICDYIYPGAIRSLQLCTNYAYTVFRDFCKDSNKQDVILSKVNNGKWQQIMTCEDIK